MIDTIQACVVIAGALVCVGVLVYYGPLRALRRARRKRAARIASPCLNGVPLPRFDDPRWSLDRYDSSAWLGEKDVRAGTDHSFLVSGNIGLRFGGREIGQWPEYVEAVLAVVKERQNADAAAKARLVIDTYGKETA